MKNLKERDGFLATYDPWKLNQEDMNNVYRTTANSVTKESLKISQFKKFRFTGT